jgi:hypothetical protein
MADATSIVPVRVAGHVISCGPCKVEDGLLVVDFSVAGPEAKPEFPKRHVAVFRHGDEEKLNSRGGWGGREADGSAYFHWEFDWPGGDRVRIVCVDGGDQIVHDWSIDL